MGFVHQGLMARGEYLADPTVPDRVGWEPYGQGQRLVVLPRHSPLASTREATPIPSGPDTVAPDSPNDPSPTSDNDPDASPGMVADPPAPAILAVVMQLVPGQSWLYPDGQWTGPTKYIRRFTDLKLLCTGGPAIHP